MCDQKKDPDRAFGSTVTKASTHSVVGMAALRAEGGVGPQLVSHTFGLLKARDTPNQNEDK